MNDDFILCPINESSGIYNAKYFGAPTNRKRFLCGEFPKPLATHNDLTAKNLKVVLESLGTPLANDRNKICDCNYPNLILSLNDVSDHQYMYKLQPFEWRTAKRLKEDKGYMGRMSFPENIDRPSRTVMATMSASSRESMVLSTPDEGYRLPTVREAACMMSFPIDYRFYGQSKGVKHTLVGNAVPPKLSYAIAKAIAEDVGNPIPDHYISIVHNQEIEFFNLNYAHLPLKTEQPKKATAKFKYHIPYLIIDSYRVELTNYHSNFDMALFKWNAEIHYSQGKKRAKVYVPCIHIEEIMPELHDRIINYLNQLSAKLSLSNDFQKMYCATEQQRLSSSLFGPYELLDSIKEFIVSEIPHESWSESKSIGDKPDKLPTAILVGYFILCEIVKKIGGIE